MDHKELKEKLEESDRGLFKNALWIIMFLWVGLLAAFLTRSWIIVFIVSGFGTLGLIWIANYVSKTNQGYLFMSYLFDEVLDKLKELEKKK